MVSNGGSAAASTWMTLEEIAGDLQIPLSTIYQWRTAGRGPKGIKVGKHVRVSRPEYEAWLRSLEADR